MATKEVSDRQYFLLVSDYLVDPPRAGAVANTTRALSPVPRVEFPVSHQDNSSTSWVHPPPIAPTECR